ncbi:MAG TPA: hypothetical protein VKM72_11450 [Thermoanaerobaculia bacterium]|nr:hypothetical protein [Thermoanaerobaculia bacterium]
MGLSDTVRDNIVVIVASAFAAGAGLSWAVAEKVRVEPMKDEVGRLEKSIEEIKDGGAGGDARTTIEKLSIELKKCESRLTVPASGGNALPAFPAPTPASSALHEVTTQDFRFELRGCTLSGSNLNCELLVTNLAGDRELQIDSGRIIDADGNEYPVRRFSLGSERRVFYVRSTLPAGTPVRAAFEFESVRPDTKLLKVLELKGYTRGAARSQVAVRLTEITL